MKALLVLLLGISGCHCKQKAELPVTEPIALDCTDNPPCPKGKLCTCLPETFHPDPSFVVDERYGRYDFTIELEKGWTCKPTVATDQQTVTVSCKKEQP